MNRTSRLLQRLSLVAALLLPPALYAASTDPLVDHHQHLFSGPVLTLINSPALGTTPLEAKDMIALLDAANIKRALILSIAYQFGDTRRKVEDEYAKVRAENDWTAAQVAQYPERLRAFCAVNPLRDYALEEIARCAANPHLRHGLKMHFGNSDVQLENPEHIARMRQVFALANANRMAIAIHMRASISKQRPYGAVQARAFIEQLLPAAPDVVVQLAHLGGAGPGYVDPPAAEVMEVITQAVERGDLRTRNLWIDVASNADKDIAPEDAARMARNLRRLGLQRILYGSDSPVGGNLRPREAWAAFRKIPLTEAEFRQIAGNVAPYMK